ncbi:hypothetical protein JL720_15558 [Aureococcus anophagefferens]|nr:hypothetical protein JL720_15558 [Aureococcus anophagefferens]
MLHAASRALSTAETGGDAAEADGADGEPEAATSFGACVAALVARYQEPLRAVGVRLAVGESIWEDLEAPRTAPRPGVVESSTFTDFDPDDDDDGSDSDADAVVDDYFEDESADRAHHDLLRRKERFTRSMRAYSILLRELLPGSSGATAIALSVAISAPSFMNARALSAPRFIAEAVRADARGSLSGKRTLRAALSHAFAALHAARAATRDHWGRSSVQTPLGAHVVRLVFVAAALVENRPPGAAREALTAVLGARPLAATRGGARKPRGFGFGSARAAPAPPRDADEYAPGGLAAGVAPHHRDETARVKARARLYSADGALPQQSALVFELLRLSHVALSALHPATAEAAVNAGWTRYFLSSVLDVFGEPREEHRRSLRDARRKTLGRRLKTAAHAALMPFCGETGDDDGDDDRERRLGARDRASPESDSDADDSLLATAAEPDGDGDAAARDGDAPPSRLPVAPAGEAAVRRWGSPRRGRRGARRPRRRRRRRAARTATPGCATARPCGASRSSAGSGAPGSAATAGDDERRSRSPRHVARIGARSATAGFDAAAEAGSRACARRDAALAKQGAALRRRARRVRPPCRDGDYRRDCHLAAAARDVRAADVAWRALRASTRDAGWAPFAADAVAPATGAGRRGAAAPRRLRVATGHRDARGGGPRAGAARSSPRRGRSTSSRASAAELKKGENAPERWRLDGLTAVRGRRYLLRPLALEFFFATRREVFVAFESPQDRRVCWRLMKLKARMPRGPPAGGTKTMRAPHLELHAIRLTALAAAARDQLRVRHGAQHDRGPVLQRPRAVLRLPWIIADYGGATAVPGELRAALGMEPARRASRRAAPPRESEDRVADADPPSDDDDDVRLDANDSDDDDDGGEPAPRARDGRARSRRRDAPPPPSSVLRDAMGADDDDAARFMYGSHYSSAGVVLHFLVRLEPFTSLALELQGGHFDCPDRLFFDVAESWRGCTTSMSDVKELVPEFFYCPELFVNDNRYPLGELQDGRAVDDVLLPAWAADARAFVRGNAAALESEAVSAALPRWIDLVFGVGAKRGTHAETHHNVFHPLTYEGGVDLTQIADATLREAAEAQITHFGQTPPPLFDAPHPPRSLKGQPEVGALFDDDRGSLAVHRGYGEARLAAPPPEPPTEEVEAAERVAAFYFKPAPDGYGRPFSLRLEFRKQLPSFPLSRARLRYCLCLATPGNLSGLSLTAEPSPQQAYVKRKGNVALQAPHHGGVTVGVVGCSGAGDLTRVVSAGYFDGAIRCHGVLDGLEAQGAAARRRGTRHCGATVVAAAECGRVVVSGHADGTATVWVDDFGDMAAALASDDVLVAAADGKPHGSGAAARAPSPRATTSAAARGRGAARARRARRRAGADDDDDREDAYAYGGDAAGAAGEAATPEDEDYDEDALFGASLRAVDASGRVERVRPLRAPGQGAQQPEPQGAVRGVQEEDDLRLLRSERADPSALSPVHVLRGGELPVCAVAVRSDLDLVAAAYPDGTIALHTARRGRFVRRLGAPGDDGRAPRAAAAPDADRLPTPRATPSR